MSAMPGGRPLTGFGQDGVSRPMTGIRGAGYPGTAAGGRPGGGVAFDPLNQAGPGRSVNSPGIDGKREESPEEKIKLMEKKVNVFGYNFFLDFF